MRIGGRRGVKRPNAVEADRGAQLPLEDSLDQCDRVPVGGDAEQLVRGIADRDVLVEVEVRDLADARELLGTQGKFVEQSPSRRELVVRAAQTARVCETPTRDAALE